MTDTSENYYRRMMHAIGSYIKTCTPPIVQQIDGKFEDLATGTFLRINDRYFLITAGHVFTSNESQTIALYCPRSPRSTQWMTIGESYIYTPKFVDFDVTVIELLSKSHIDELNRGWRFVSLGDVAWVSHGPSIFILGYPREWASDAGQFNPKEFFMHTGLMDRDVPREIKWEKGLDYFADYADSPPFYNNDGMRSPNLQGCSGAGVWQIQDHKDDHFVAEEHLKLIGIQVSMASSMKFLRFKAWWVVGGCFFKVFPELEDVFRAYPGAMPTLPPKVP